MLRNGIDWKDTLILEFTKNMSCMGGGKTKMKTTHVRQHIRRISKRKDTNTKLARRKIYRRFGWGRVSKIRFGKIRRDGTRSVIFRLDGNPVSFSYLTDI